MGRVLGDFALPPRCPGCGLIVPEDHQFCQTCWGQLDFLGGPACAACSLPLPGPDQPDMLCGRCLAEPPPFFGAPAAVAYGPVARTVALRLKYGRRVGHAQLMARLMARHVPASLPDGDGAHAPPLLVPVPLYRWRMWSRGFNQAALIADHLARLTSVEANSMLLIRTKRTPSMRGLGRKGRARAVRGAFAMAPGHSDRVRGRHVILIDDVHASGATLTACAKVLRRAGAARVSVITWARVIPAAMARDRAPIDFVRQATDI